MAQRDQRHAQRLDVSRLQRVHGFAGLLPALAPSNATASRKLRWLVAVPLVALLTSASPAAAVNRPHIVCWRNYHTWSKPIRPRTCTLHKRHRHTFFKLRDLHWYQWGRYQARGRGRVLSTTGRSYRVKKIELFGARWGWGKHGHLLYYSRVDFRLPSGSHVVFWTDVPHGPTIHY